VVIGLYCLLAVTDGIVTVFLSLCNVQ
jgi:hypothetical protein